MKVRGLVDYDICNYKIPSIFVIFPYCTFKCDHDCGHPVCQNSDLVNEPIINITAKEIIVRYLNNPLTHALVCGGLEPFDSKEDLYELIKAFRNVSKDPIIIYTGYNEYELEKDIKELKRFDNITIKFGRFVPNDKGRYDANLGKIISSRNQYSKLYLDGKEFDSRCF